MVKKRSISECDFTEIFHFAKEKYGIEWNPANDLFFSTELLRCGTIHEVHPAEMPSYIDFMTKNNFKKSSDVPREVFDAMEPMDQARVILLAFGEVNDAPFELLVDCT